MENNILLTPIPLHVLLVHFRAILQEEIKLIQQTSLGERMLSVQEACKVFVPAISRQTLNNWTRDGKLPAKKIGGKLYYRYSELLSACQTLKKYKR